MKAAHPLLSGLAGFVLAPLGVGLLTRLIVNKDDPAMTTALKTGAMHTAGAIGSWFAMERLDGDGASFAKGALVGEALDAIFAPATIVAADAVRQMMAKAQQLPNGPQPLPTPPPQDAIDPEAQGVTAVWGSPGDPLPEVGTEKLVNHDELQAERRAHPDSTWTEISGGFLALVQWVDPATGIIVVKTPEDIGLPTAANETVARLLIPAGTNVYVKPPAGYVAPSASLAAKVSGKLTTGLLACAKTPGSLPPLCTIEQAIAQLKGSLR